MEDRFSLRRPMGAWSRESALGDHLANLALEGARHQSLLAEFALALLTLLGEDVGVVRVADGIYALRTLRESGGTATAVPEDQVVEGMKLLAETEGVFTEAAGGVTVWGLKQLAATGAIGKDDLTVAYITGNGLKTQEVIEGVVNPITILPTLKSFEEAMASLPNGA